MEIWQHLLVLLIGGSGISLGALVALYTQNEVKHAEKHLIFFTQLCGLLLIWLTLNVFDVHPLWYVGFAALFAAYVAMKMNSPKMQSLKHQKRTLTNYVFYAAFGALYGLVSYSNLVLVFSAIVFIDSLTIGSLAQIRGKDSLEFAIPWGIYVAAGLLSTLVFGVWLGIAQF